MRKIPSRFLALAYGFLLLTTPALSAESRLSDAVPLDRELKSALGALAPGRYVVVFKRKSISLKAGVVTYMAGAVVGGKAPVFTDCFLFVKGIRDKGRVFFTATKAATIWSCVGDPKIDAIATRSDGASMLVLSMFLYQAPSGDFFNLPFIVQSGSSGEFDFGQVDKCVDKKLDRIELKSVSQLRKYASECTKP